MLPLSNTQTQIKLKSWDRVRKRDNRFGTNQEKKDWDREREFTKLYARKSPTSHHHQIPVTPHVIFFFFIVKIYGLIII